MTRRAFAHDAVVRMTAGADPNAPGGAITIALCGHWDHQPPCPLSPHHTSAAETGNIVQLRILFAANAEDECRVRALLDQALASGALTGPDDHLSTWMLYSSEASPVRPDEADHAARLAQS